MTEALHEKEHKLRIKVSESVQRTSNSMLISHKKVEKITCKEQKHIMSTSLAPHTFLLA